MYFSGSLKGSRKLVLQVTCLRGIFTGRVDCQVQQGRLAINWAKRVDLAVAFRALEYYGMHEGVCNHLSTKAPAMERGGEVILVVPYGIYWSEVTPKCLIGLDLDEGSVVEGTGKAAPAASMIHRAIYSYRPDVDSVMHTHGTYSTVLGLLKRKEIKMLHQNSTRFVHNVAYDDDYDAPPFSASEECDRIARTLADKDVLLMGNHGLLTVGNSVALAFDTHYYFEQAAKVQILAYQTGRELSQMKEAVVEAAYRENEATKDFYAAAHLDSFKRKFLSEHPESFAPN